MIHRRRQHTLEGVPLEGEWRAWNVVFHIVRPLPGLAAPVQAAAAETADPAYAKSGAERAATPHAAFQYTVSGRGEFVHGERVLSVPAGHGFLCRLSDPTVAYRYPGSAAEPWRFVFFEFLDAGAVVDALVAAHGHIYALDPRAPALARILHLDQRTHGRTIHRDLGAAVGGRLVFDLLLALAASGEVTAATSAAARLVARARALVDADEGGDCDLAALAAALDVSREHLSRVFRAETGLSLGLYQRRRRLARACDLLRDGVCGAVVARRLGYGSATNFTRAFKRAYGCTPSVFLSQGGIV